MKKSKIIILMYILVGGLFVQSCGTDGDSIEHCADGVMNGNETSTDCGGDCEVCENTIIGVYNGLLRIRDFNDIDDILFESSDANLSIKSCLNNCIDIDFQVDGGSTKAKGTYQKSNGFYFLDIPPVYEIEGEIQSYEEDYTQGSGSFDIENKKISISLTVADEHSIGGTESAYFFEGAQN